MPKPVLPESFPSNPTGLLNWRLFQLENGHWNHLPAKPPLMGKVPALFCLFKGCK